MMNGREKSDSAIASAHRDAFAPATRKRLTQDFYLV
jgi:hypothetical protein